MSTAEMSTETVNNQGEIDADPYFLGLFARLAAPFHPSEIRSRSQGGRQFVYITARVVMNRLDEVMGPSNWWDTYQPHENSVLCRLTIRLPDGTLLTKEDAGGYAGMADQGDDDKSGVSDGLKRAAAKFGVGRYLYRDGVPGFVLDHYEFDAEFAPGANQPSPQRQPDRSGEPRNSRPDLPAQRNGANGQGGGNVPKTGKALFAWVKEQEEKSEVSLLKYLNSFGKLQEWPGRMVDWDADQVALAHGECLRKLQTVGQGRDEPYREEDSR